jgi:8-oxo-dGTP diphosphatase
MDNFIIMKQSNRYKFLNYRELSGLDVIYTICFIQKENQLLMLYRRKAPNLHKWNGVGGKIEKGEDPEQSIRREVLEETGLTIMDPKYRGVVSWNNGVGMHVYTATKFEGELTPCEEGPLEWKPIQWIRESSEVVSNIPIFLDHMLSEQAPVEYSFIYNEAGIINSFKKIPLEVLNQEPSLHNV